MPRSPAWTRDRSTRHRDDVLPEDAVMERSQLAAQMAASAKRMASMNFVCAACVVVIRAGPSAWSHGVAFKSAPNQRTARPRRRPELRPALSLFVAAAMFGLTGRTSPPSPDQLRDRLRVLPLRALRCWAADRSRFPGPVNGFVVDDLRRPRRRSARGRRELGGTPVGSNPEPAVVTSGVQKPGRTWELAVDAYRDSQFVATIIWLGGRL